MILAMKKLLILLIIMLGNQIGNTQWMQTNGPAAGGFVRDIISDENYLYAGSSGGGVYRSGDQGESWTRVNNGLNNLTIYALASN